MGDNYFYVIMKKYLYVICLLLACISMQGQTVKLYPKCAVSYSLQDRIRIRNGFDKATYNLPDVTVRTGLEARYKKLSVYYDSRFWCAFRNKYVSFDPQQAVFEVGATYRFTSKIALSVRHTCYHPIYTDGENHAAIYGGHIQFTLSYGY